MEKDINHQAHTITIWRNGIHCQGSYTVDDQHLTVYLGKEAISVKLYQISHADPLAVAADLLAKLVSKEKMGF